MGAPVPFLFGEFRVDVGVAAVATDHHPYPLDVERPLAAGGTVAGGDRTSDGVYH